MFNGVFRFYKAPLAVLFSYGGGGGRVDKSPRISPVHVHIQSLTIFLSISFNISFGGSKESSHRDGFLSTTTYVLANRK